MENILVSVGLYGGERDHFEDDDFVDRLNNRYTILGLVLCIFIVSGSLYIGDPINCWTPGVLKSSPIPSHAYVF